MSSEHHSPRHDASSQPRRFSDVGPETAPSAETTVPSLEARPSQAELEAEVAVLREHFRYALSGAGSVLAEASPDDVWAAARLVASGHLDRHGQTELLGAAHELNQAAQAENLTDYEAPYKELKLAIYGTTEVDPMTTEAKLTAHPTLRAGEHQSVDVAWTGLPIEVILWRAEKNEDRPYVVAEEKRSTVQVRLGENGTWYAQVGDHPARPLSREEKNVFGRSHAQVPNNDYISGAHVEMEYLPDGRLKIIDTSKFGTYVLTSEFPDQAEFAAHRAQQSQEDQTQRIDEAREHLDQAA